MNNLVKDSKYLLSYISTPLRFKTNVNKLFQNILKNLLLGSIEEKYKNTRKESVNSNSSIVSSKSKLFIDNLDDLNKLDHFQIWNIIENTLKNKLNFFNTFTNYNNYLKLIKSELKTKQEEIKRKYLNKKRKLKGDNVRYKEDIKCSSSSNNIDYSKNSSSDNNQDIEDDDEETFNMDDFEEFNNEVEKIENKKDIENDYKHIISDSINNISDEENLYDNNELDNNEENLTYSKIYKYNISKQKNINNINDDNEIENSIFAKEHGYDSDTNSNLLKKQKIIEEIHNKMLEDKPWEMKGEIKAKDRPIGSLLDKNLDFKVSKKQVPLVTPELSSKIENLIKLRVSKGLFDNPKMNSYLQNKENEHKNNFILNYNKSSKGIADLYEEDFNKLNDNNNNLLETKSQEKQEIEDLMNELFTMFTAVTSNTFISQTIKEDINVIKDIDVIEIKDISKNIVNNENAIINKQKSKKIEDMTNEIRKTQTRKGFNLFVKSNEEMNTKELKSKHNALKRKLKKRIYQKNLQKQKYNLSKDYDSKFEVDLKLKQNIDKSRNLEAKSKELKSTNFFSNIQNNKELYTKNYIKKTTNSDLRDKKVFKL